MKALRTLVLSLLSLTLITAFTAGCETTEGAGRDIQKAGNAIEDAAD